ncbi:MAG: putative proline rich signal peptide protein [Variovorax sp.]|nr:putative proline rich signal peptide protein [Variovorax sp.]
MTTTASSTHSSKKPLSADRRAALRAVAAGLLVAGLGGVPVSARAAEVTQLHLERDDDSIYLNALVDFELPALVGEVLDKGIALFFVAEAELFRERWYWTDRKVAQASRHMRLAYQPLTRRWRLNVSPQPITNARLGVAFNQNFDELADALDAIKRIGRLRLGDLGEIGDDNAPHPVTFRFRLDVSQLPRPFQIGVVGNNDWNMVAERSARLPLEKGP